MHCYEPEPITHLLECLIPQVQVWLQQEGQKSSECECLVAVGAGANSETSPATPSLSVLTMSMLAPWQGP